MRAFSQPLGRYDKIGDLAPETSRADQRPSGVALRGAVERMLLASPLPVSEATQHGYDLCVIWLLAVRGVHQESGIQQHRTAQRGRI
jgi:hypothetical protein